MKLSILLLTLVFSSAAFADEQANPSTNPFQAKPIDRPFVKDQKSTCQSDSKTSALEQRGCCSHHDGVCGCAGGRAQCCDGALSPTCGC